MISGRMATVMPAHCLRPYQTTANAPTMDRTVNGQFEASGASWNICPLVQSKTWCDRKANGSQRYQRLPTLWISAPDARWTGAIMLAGSFHTMSIAGVCQVSGWSAVSLADHEYHDIYTLPDPSPSR